VIATLLGSVVALLGSFWEPMKPLYDWSWFVGFAIAASTYFGLMKKR
jgi:cytosine/uracil/thiamine/allantoin permease